MQSLDVGLSYTTLLKLEEGSAVWCFAADDTEVVVSQVSFLEVWMFTWTDVRMAFSFKNPTERNGRALVSSADSVLAVSKFLFRERPKAIGRKRISRRGAKM